MRFHRKTVLWTLAGIIAFVAVSFLLPRYLFLPSWGRTDARPPAQPTESAASTQPIDSIGEPMRPPGLVGAPFQPAQEQEEDRLLGSLPGHYPASAAERLNDGGYLPVQAEMLSPLPQPFQTLLLSMHKRKPQRGTDGGIYPLSFAGVVPEDGMYIYDLCRRVRPQRTLEIGFAEGFSAMYFLAAAKANGMGSHVAIDPFENRDWHGLGLQKVKETGMEDRFRFMEALSVSALPALASEGLKFEVIFIDGDHRFDTQLADFLLSDALCPKGGYILLHDVWMASTRKLISFIERNRADYKRHPTPLDIATFQKIDEDRRDWRHFVEF
jgi:predicted O-methyltransferase YrrM